MVIHKLVCIKNGINAKNNCARGLTVSCKQGRNEVRLHPGQDTSLTPPHIRTYKIFRKQMYRIEESTRDVVGSFWCPRQ